VDLKGVGAGLAPVREPEMARENKHDSWPWIPSQAENDRGRKIAKLEFGIAKLKCILAFIWQLITKFEFRNPQLFHTVTMSGRCEE